MDHYPIRLGYACINTDLRDYGIFTSRNVTLRMITQKGVDYIKELALQNIDDLFQIIIYNEAHGIRLFRISSAVFPHLGNPLLPVTYDLQFAKPKLKLIGEYARQHGHRLTMHPGQFVQLGSPNSEVVSRSMTDLVNHAQLLKMLGYGPTDGAVLIIHGGGTYNDKMTTLTRWRHNFLSLPVSVRHYVVLENDETNYGVLDLLPLCEELQIPFCLDIFHNNISKDHVVMTRKLMERIFNTWRIRSIIPKFHMSEQQVGLRRGAHSKTIDNLPSYLFTLPEMFKTPLDVMLEVKDKEVSVFKLFHRYFDAHIDATGRVTYTVKKLKFEPLE